MRFFLYIAYYNATGRIPLFITAHLTVRVVGEIIGISIGIFRFLISYLRGGGNVFAELAVVCKAGPGG